MPAPRSEFLKSAASADAQGAMFIYHERQLGGLCGVHCLNNLLQGPHFGPGDLAEIGMELDKEEQAIFGNSGEYQPYNVDSSADGGNFSIQVLTRALQRFGLELLPAKHPRAKDLMKDPAKSAEAFLCQYKDHWFAVREAAECWWNLNSTRQKPGLVSPFLLAAWLGQLSAEGHSIFLVLGSKMPERAKPQKDEKAAEENFHALFDLLEQAKDPNDRPLQGGDAGPVEVPPEFQEWEQSYSSSSPPPSPWPPNSQEAVIENQRRLLEQARAGTGGYVGGAPAASPANPRESAVETQRRLLEQAKANSRQAGNNASAPRPGGGAPASTGTAWTGKNEVVENQRRMLEEANRKAALATRPSGASATTNVAPTTAPQRGGTAPSNPAQAAIEQQRMLLEQAKNDAFAAQQARQTGGGPAGQQLRSSISEPADLKALREMGFKEPLIRTAQALAKGNVAVMSDLLLRLRNVPADVERSGERLAKAIQDAVLSLDTPELNAYMLLQLSSLLCLDEVHLSRAAAHYDADVLREFLLSILARRREWSPEVRQAVSVVVENLAAAPTVAGSAKGDVDGAPRFIDI